MQIEHHETKRGGECIKALPLAHDPYLRFTLYSLALPKLSSGDIVQLHSQFEVTNDLGFNVMLAHAMMIHDEETIVSGVVRFPTGEFVLPCVPAGENITPGMHHGFRTLVGSKTVTSDGDAWASVLIYSASSAAKSGRANARRFHGLA